MTQFHKTVCKIAIPVMLQSMLQASFSIIDQLMIGQLGEESISAVGVISNFTMILNFVLMTIATVAGILISQFIGAKDEKETWSVFFLSLVVSLGIAVAFLAGTNLLPGQILGCYTKDQVVIGEGMPYLRLVSLTFLPMACINIIAAYLRCEEHATMTLIASFLAVLCNTTCNYVLIFGKFGFQAMGITGAGIATSLSEIFNLIFILIGFFVCIKKDHKKIIWTIGLHKITIKDYLIMLSPVLLSEFLWSLGQNVFSSVYGHIGTESLAAYTLTSPIQGMLVGALSGLSASAGVIIGKQLGNKEFDEAYESSKKLMWLGLIGSVLLGSIMFVFRNFYVSFYDVDGVVRQQANMLLAIFALYMPVKVENMILGGGIIRSGGDTKTIMIIDIIGTWIVGVPLCLLSANVWGLSIVWVYAILSSEEIVRFVITFVMFRRKNWMRSIAK